MGLLFSFLYDLRAAGAWFFSNAKSHVDPELQEN
jgi:hypothetical protein